MNKTGLQRSSGDHMIASIIPFWNRSLVWVREWSYGMLKGWIIGETKTPNPNVTLTT